MFNRTDAINEFASFQFIKVSRTSILLPECNYTVFKEWCDKTATLLNQLNVLKTQTMITSNDELSCSRWTWILSLPSEYFFKIWEESCNEYDDDSLRRTTLHTTKKFGYNDWDICDESIGVKNVFFTGVTQQQTPKGRRKEE